MKRKKFTVQFALLAVLLLIANMISAQQNLKLGGKFYTAEFNFKKGVYTVKHNSEVLVKNARIELKTENKVFSSTDKGIQYESLISAFTDPLGEGNKMQILMKQAGMEITIAFKSYNTKDLISIDVDVLNSSGKDIPLQEIRPLVVDGTASSNLKVGDKIKGTRLLTMGYSFVDSGELMFLDNQHFDYSSNCNMAFYIPEQSFGLTIGSINFDHTETQIFLRNDPKKFENGKFPGYGLKITCSTNKTGASMYRYKKTDQFSSQVTRDNYNIEMDGWMPDDSTERYNEYLLKAGASLSSGPVAFIIDKDPNNTLEYWADYFHDYNDVKLNTNLPNGWSSWADLYYNIDEGKMLKVCDFIVDQNLPDFGFNMIQIDDGFQEQYGDWDGNLYFPHGMKWLADEIRKRGLTPGIWLAPYTFSINTPEAKHHQEMMFKHKGADTAYTIPYYLDFPVYIMDVSVPESQHWLDSMYTVVSKDWGYKLFKLDFILHSIAEGTQLADVYMTKAEAYRLGLKIAKNALGEDGYLLECGIMTAAGATDGWRTDRDSEARWHEIVMEHGTGHSTPKHYYMNGKLFNTDADQLLVRDGWGLTVDMARVMATNVAMGGSQVLAADEFYKLPEERLNIIKSVIPPYGKAARSVDLFDVNQPAINALHIEEDNDDWWVISVTNWTDDQQERKIDLLKAGLDENQKYFTFEFWEQEFMGVHKNEIKLRLKPTSVQVIALRKVLDRPQIIGTNRHILQGAVDLKDVKWDAQKKQIKGEFLGAREHTFSLTVFVPDGFILQSADSDGSLINTEKVAKNLYRLTLDFGDRKVKTFDINFQ